jgi:hypothetical protein
MMRLISASSVSGAAQAQAAAGRVLPPQGWWEYAVVAAAVVVVAVALVWLVVGFLRIGEEDPGHIKYSILAENGHRSEDGGTHDEA